MRITYRVLVSATLLFAVALPAFAGEPGVSLVIGNLLPAEGGHTNTPSPLKSPFGVDFDSEGNMLIVELAGGRVHRLTPNGELATIADDLNEAVRRYNPQTKVVTTVVGRGHGKPAFELLHPHGVCFETGKLYVVDTGNNRIFRVDLPVAEDWSRFRGPNGSGVSSSVELPDSIDPETNLLWKAEPGKGSSSPIVAKERLYVTSYEGDERSLHCLNATTGERLWQRSVRKVRDEAATNPNSPATCTPATDGKNVVAFFPDAGLFCFSTDGDKLWSVDAGPFHSMHGIACSPVLVDGLVVLTFDQLRDSKISAYKLSSGELAWSAPRIDGLTGAYSTPCTINRENGPSTILTSGPQEFCAYRASSGERLWSVPGLTNAPISLPVASNNRVFVCESVGKPVPFSLLASMDKDKDGKYSMEEAKASVAMHRLLQRIERDHGNGDGTVEPSEWNAAFGGFLNKGGLSAVDLPDEGSSDLPEIRWTYRKSVPSIASPLVFDGVLYIVQDGGIVTTFDPETGEVLRRGRLSQGGKKFYASPVAGDGKVYVIDTEGRLTVLKAGRDWEELSSTDLGEPCFATPALCDGRVFVRTSKTLYCFGKKKHLPY